MKNLTQLTKRYRSPIWVRISRPVYGQSYSPHTIGRTRMAKSSDLHHSRWKRKDSPQSARHAFGVRHLSRRHCQKHCQRKAGACAFIRGTFA